VTCPWHGWKFDVWSGEMTMNRSRFELLPDPSRCRRRAGLLLSTRCMRNRRPRHAKASVRLRRDPSKSPVPDLI
jgi:nitrite reductase/ring-hydroxylating ferredoxin subunit